MTPDSNAAQLGDLVMSMLKKYQQYGKQQVSAGQLEQTERGSAQLPSDLANLNLSPSQQLGFRRGEVGAVEPSIGGARKLVQEAESGISEVKSYLEELRRLDETKMKTAQSAVQAAIQSGSVGLQELVSVSPEVVKAAGYDAKTLTAIASGLKKKEAKDASDLTTYQRTQTFNNIVSKYNSSPLVQASDRTPVLRAAVDAIKKDPGNGALQLNLSYAYIQALDTYQSSVREGELGNLNSIDSRIGEIQGQLQKIQNGQIVRPDVALKIANAAGQVIDTISSAASQKSQSFKSQADVSGVGDMWDQFEGSFTPSYQQQENASDWVRIP